MYVQNDVEGGWRWFWSGCIIIMNGHFGTGSRFLKYLGCPSKNRWLQKKKNGEDWFVTFLLEHTVLAPPPLNGLLLFVRLRSPVVQEVKASLGEILNRKKVQLALFTTTVYVVKIEHFYIYIFYIEKVGNATNFWGGISKTAAAVAAAKFDAPKSLPSLVQYFSQFCQDD